MIRLSHCVITFVIFHSISGEQFPCPFNPQLCTCTDDTPPSLFQFFTAECKSPSSNIPVFDSKYGPYNITGFFRITSPGFKIPARHFVAFQKINYLYLYQTPQSPSINWDPDAFSGVDIQAFKASGIEDLIPPPAALKNLGHSGLKELDIVNIKKSIDLPRGVFMDFISLNILTISNAPIGFVDDNAFYGLETHLRELSLTETACSQIPSAIYNLQKLTKLNLVNNKITRINFSFSVLSNLQILSLSGNNVGQSVESGDLDSLPQTLDQLHLDSTGLTSTPTRVLKNLRVLTSLTLMRNSIQKLRDKDFQNNGELRILMLDYNPISSIDQTAFAPLQNSYFVSFQFTALKSIDLILFASMTSSSSTIGTTLLLSNNLKLKNFSASHVTKYPALTRIQLVNTGLETIDPNVQEFLDNIPDVKIDISSNKHLQCSDLDWMTKVSCPDRMIIRDAACADKDKQSLEDYLKSVSPDSKCRIDSETTPRPALQSTTKGASSISAQIWLIAISFFIYSMKKIS